MTTLYHTAYPLLNRRPFTLHTLSTRYSIVMTENSVDSSINTLYRYYGDINCWTHWVSTSLPLLGSKNMHFSRVIRHHHHHNHTIVHLKIIVGLNACIKRTLCYRKVTTSNNYCSSPHDNNAKMIIHVHVVKIITVGDSNLKGSPSLVYVDWKCV